VEGGIIPGREQKPGAVRGKKLQEKRKTKRGQEMASTQSPEETRLYYGESNEIFSKTAAACETGKLLNFGRD